MIFIFIHLWNSDRKKYMFGSITADLLALSKTSDPWGFSRMTYIV
ncbi:MAG: hypothetical protein Harvfovirus20_12 [Harvfovirus sp.]|uniref:Uncharacterized protein n=1 Tax=Harvfovirus sp. TaxID=2487768 RepID=A0A3G5A5U2_9VIRU|nr:MAG: hypothetical protein Harvfovirus20_12 [Harvfovirus sp.]